MPPTKKNPFICFALARKREMEAQGVNFPEGIKSAVDKFGPEWAKMSSADRLRYKQEAKQEKANARSSGPSPSAPLAQSNDTATSNRDADNSEAWESLKTTHGQTLGSIINEQCQEDIKEDFWQMYTQKIFARDSDEDGGIEPYAEDQRFLIIDFNAYTQFGRDNTFIPAEIGLVTFSLKEGVVDSYSTLIDPVEIPTGLASEVKTQCKTLAVPSPGYGNDCDDYEKIIRVIDKFIELNSTHLGPKKITFLYCLRPEFKKVEGCLNWLLKKCGLEGQRVYHVASLSFLLQLFARYGKLFYLYHLEMTEFNKRSKEEPFKVTEEELAAAVRSKLGVDPDHSPCLPGFPIDDGRHRARRIPHTYSHMMLEEPVYQYTAGTAAASDTLGLIPENRSAGSLNDNGSEAPRGAMNFEYANDSVAVAYCNSKVKEGPAPDNQLFMFESMAEDFLGSLDLAYCKELACLHHGLNQAGIPTCCLNVVQRMAYNIIDVLIGYFPTIMPIEGQHFPMREVQAEEFKRRAQQLVWGRYGYQGLDGFLDSTPSEEPTEEEELYYAEYLALKSKNTGSEEALPVADGDNQQ